MNNRELWIVAGVLGFLWLRAKQTAAPVFIPAGGDAMRPVVLPPAVYLPKVANLPTVAAANDPNSQFYNPGSTSWQGPGVYGMRRDGVVTDTKFFFRDQFANWINAGYRVVSQVMPKYSPGFWDNIPSVAQAQAIWQDQSGGLDWDTYNPPITALPQYHG